MAPDRLARVEGLAPTLDLIEATLLEAECALRPAQRYLVAYDTAQRIAAEALRGRPRRRGALHARGGAPRNIWLVLAEVAPELGEWSEYFGALQLRRRAIAAGAVALVTEREADDLVRDARSFRTAVEMSRARYGAGVRVGSWEHAG